MAGHQKHRKIYVLSGTAALIMFGFCFAIVPFYSAICKATGINTSLRADLITPSTSKEGVDLSREVTVQFIAMNNMGLPWDFYPRVKSIRVHPGENNKVYFHAKNPTGKDMTVQAIPSMTPTEALSHFHKIQCFCFNQQTLRAYEGREMPLIFNVDKNLPKDIRVITLVYTLFDVTPKESKKG
ncbi:MAG: cytochrome c oxidase assembly protein [uncultured bacterium]|nr:MAG: cytochrome c oxidase assembly protein [uncultured bacterium]